MDGLLVYENSQIVDNNSLLGPVDYNGVGNAHDSVIVDTNTCGQAK